MNTKVDTYTNRLNDFHLVIEDKTESTGKSYPPKIEINSVQNT